MGRGGAGKTSMQSIIFHNNVAKKTRDLEPTVLWNNQVHVQFIGNLCLNIWDCGGQDESFHGYLTDNQDVIFKDVHVLIYVFDAISAELDKDIHYYQSCLESILIHSPKAIVFCLMHKMDLIQEDKREKLFERQQQELQVRSEPIQIKVFQTSIWDETLYAAWASIIHHLIPNMASIQTSLDGFCQICGADEVVLFDKTTFLVIANAATIDHPDIHRFEKISSIIKQFNLCTRKEAYSRQMEIKGSNFTAFFDTLTTNTSVLLIISDTSITSAAIQVNIAAARKCFEQLEST
ncbi:Gtr1/RagA G protein conserved region-domain-containing protein [Blakeslea trispora]|nr:Gtr1/RagA G protein conserved region-domain-containing protein [Blakeslea trispora]